MAQMECASAPEEGIREICKQIHKWDHDVRRYAFRRPFHAAGTDPNFPRTDSSLSDCMDMSCICSFLQGTMSGSWCLLPDNTYTGKSIRKEYRQLTDEERARYHAAVWAIRRDGSYLQLSTIHSRFQISAGAHSGPAFLPWHREFIKRMELALRKYDPTVSLPYWDSILDNNIPNPLDSVLWSDELLGYPERDFSVKRGAFANFPFADDSRAIKRRLGEQSSLMTEDHVRNFMSFTSINDVLASTAPRKGCSRSATWQSLEYTHGLPHIYVGGDMLLTTNSTNDPIFFLHHSFIDLLWENWRITKQSPSQRESDYPPDDGLCNSQSHFSTHGMDPFPKTNKDGLSNKYADIISYQSRPTCSWSNRDCGSRFLFCDVSHVRPRCASKIRIGGNCTGFINDEPACHNGICRNNRCEEDISTTTTALISRVPVTLPPTTTTRTTVITSQTTRATIPITTRVPTTTTTRRTVSTTTTARPTAAPTRPTDEECYNDNHCCGGWAAYGECRRNPLYMSLSCKASCNVCRPNYDLNIECSDRAPNCDGRIQLDGCRTPWMFENCRQSCNLCSVTRLQQCTAPEVVTSIIATTRAPLTARVITTTTTTSPVVRVTSQSNSIPRESTCWNFHYCCRSWAASGYCQSPIHIPYMDMYCAPSCNKCGSETPPSALNGPECRDFHPSCSFWASRNECAISEDYMSENCKLSCRRCNLQSLSTLNTVCGNHRQIFLSNPRSSTRRNNGGTRRIISPFFSERSNNLNNNSIL